MSRDTAVGTLEGQGKLQNEAIAALKKGKISCPICAQDWSAKFILEQSSHILRYQYSSSGIEERPWRQDTINMHRATKGISLEWTAFPKVLEPYTSYGPNYEIPS